MSSSTHSTDEVVDEGQGYADGAVESSSLVGSSIDEEKALEVASEEGEVEMKVDAAREWTDATPPPTVIGYDLAPHEVGLYAPYFITSDSLEYLVSALRTECSPNSTLLERVGLYASALCSLYRS